MSLINDGDGEIEIETLGSDCNDGEDEFNFVPFGTRLEFEEEDGEIESETSSGCCPPAESRPPLVWDALEKVDKRDGEMARRLKRASGQQFKKLTEGKRERERERERERGRESTLL